MSLLNGAGQQQSGIFTFLDVYFNVRARLVNTAMIVSSVYKDLCVLGKHNQLILSFNMYWRICVF